MIVVSATTGASLGSRQAARVSPAVYVSHTISVVIVTPAHVTAVTLPLNRRSADYDLPYVIGQAIIFLPCGFFLSIFYIFPGLILAVAEYT